MAYLDAVTRLGPDGGPRTQYVGFAAVASAAITADALTEADVVAGGKTIVIVLTGDTWIADITAVRQAIIDGLDSAQSELLGWNSEVRDKEVVTAVARTNDTTVTITLSAAASFDITADETVTVTVPASALTGSTELIGSPIVGITADVEVSTGGRRRSRKRYVVEVDGQFIEVNSISEAESILGKVRDIAEQSAKRDVVTAVVPKPPKITVRTISGNVTTSKTLQQVIQRTQKVVNQAYVRRANEIKQDIEISGLILAKIEKQDRDDESAIIALLLM